MTVFIDQKSFKWRLKVKVTISVITATYNRKKFLRDCIESVANSILSPRKEIAVEHIVFDGGSTDGTNEWIKSTYPSLKYFREERIHSPAEARNKAIRHAQGEYIFVLDSDDVILQRTLYHFYTHLERKAESWAYSDFLRVDKNLRYILAQDYYGWEYRNPQAMLESMFAGQHFIQHNVMFAKELFFKVGGYDEELEVAEDLDLFIRFLLHGEMPLYLPIISHLHRKHESNFSIGQGGAQHLKNLEHLKRKYKWDEKGSK